MQRTLAVFQLLMAAAAAWSPSSFSAPRCAVARRAALPRPVMQQSEVRAPILFFVWLPF